MTREPRLMAVHAHPDDESSKGAATMAHYATIGRVRVVTCTGGERGSILNPRLVGRTDIEENMPAIRQQEMTAAAEALGIEHTWLGFVDSGLPEGEPLPPLPDDCFASIPLEEPVGRLVAEIREFKPQVLTTYNELGGYPHPDHIRVHEVSMAAVEAASDPTRFPEAGDPWTVSKVYYDVSFSPDRIQAFHEVLIAEGLESPFAEWMERRGKTPTRRVDARLEVSEFFPQRDQALLAHATQIDPDGFFMAVPRDIEARVWPWEEFELAHSVVGYPDEIETDLFARIEE
ncbi:mycothiol conjugate amidase Mca [Flaviflexus salsibiostraticola]|uniref:mycothiol conjugate amidase Mca n=1 Tax=Flaviflexus salsibiostraticola TaxID=1282737 RepID=UPI001FEB2708|nr:mycothiol conjugate amidase Mca [Flaviflexus salsibiostraticola]